MGGKGGKDVLENPGGGEHEADGATIGVGVQLFPGVGRTKVSIVQ